MSAPGRPKREWLPLGGTARSAKGAHRCVAGPSQDAGLQAASGGSAAAELANEAASVGAP